MPRLGRLVLCAALLSALAVVGSAMDPPAEPSSLLVYDFEAEGQVGAFAVSDSLQATDPTQRLAYLFGSNLAPDRVGGQRSLYVVFHGAQDAWASIGAPVDGAAWAGTSATALSFWVNPSSSQLSFEVSLLAGEVVYRAQAQLTTDGWQRLEVPLDRFLAEDNTPASGNLAAVTRLEIGKRGTWESCIFRIDQIEAVCRPAGETTTPPEGPTVPAEGPGDTPVGPTGPTTVPPAAEEPYTASVSANYLEVSPLYFRPYLGGNAGPEDIVALSDPAVAGLVKALEPMVRLAVTVPPAPGDDATAFAGVERDIKALSAVARDRGVLLCVRAPLDASVSPERYAGFCGELAARFGTASGTRLKVVRYWELLDSPVLISDQDYRTACQLANSAAKKLRAADADARIGGMAFFAAQRGLMERVLRGTKGALNFLSWHFYGASMASVADSDLFLAADSGQTWGKPDVIGPDQVVELLKVADLYENGLLFVTECNVNNVRTVAGASQDPRIESPIAGAWLASYLVTVGSVVDVVLLSHLVGDSWGMVHPDGTAGPLYWTARLFREHFPRNGQLVAAASTGRSRLLAVGASYETHKALLLVNRANQPAVFSLDCGGFSGKVSAKLYGADLAESRIVSEDLPLQLESRRIQPPTPAGATAPPAPIQETRARVSGVRLPAYGVAVVEFRAVR